MPAPRWSPSPTGPQPGEYARRIEILLERREFHHAKLVIDEYSAAVIESERQKTSIELVDMLLSETDLPTRLVTLLDKRNVFTVRDVLNLDREQLWGLRGIGESAYREVLGMLGDLGFPINGAAKPPKQRERVKSTEQPALP